MKSSKDNAQSLREEIANSITHGVGAILSIAGLILLIVFSVLNGTAWHVVTFAVFGSTAVLLYISSTLYHSLTGKKVKFLFRKFDHMSIYLLIAGTYTPFCLVALNGWLGWTMFGLIWGCATTGVILKLFYTGKNENLSTSIYIIMGWVGMVGAKPLYEGLPDGSFMLLLAGGLFYTLGTYFFFKDNIRYFHAVWHLFVIAGTTTHFFSIINLLEH
jgi:hemolysin III